MIPYISAVKERIPDGKLTEPVSDGRFNDKFKVIAEKIAGQKEKGL